MPEEPTEKPPVVNYSAPPDPPGTENPIKGELDLLGFTPNFRKADNVFQTKFIGATVLVCIVAAFVWYYLEPTTNPIWVPLIMGGFAGLVIGVIVSGAVLAFRRAKK